MSEQAQMEAPIARIIDICTTAVLSTTIAVSRPDSRCR